MAEEARELIKGQRSYLQCFVFAISDTFTGVLGATFAASPLHFDSLQFSIAGARAHTAAQMEDVWGVLTGLGCR